ncbi:hypothetical protein DM860_013044 [Cuscuta australis]|uniref:Uncharacterized protein n=1 Tax=Cuscuta australis TaxID=267555 RepID=A0A328D7D5_9ASTE|nr:hypothetical protein DM860_013044 [Cuscuta australis]
MLHCCAESSRFPPDAASPETLQPPGSGVQEILGLAFLCETKPKKLNSPLHFALVFLDLKHYPKLRRRADVQIPDGRFHVQVKFDA